MDKGGILIVGERGEFIIQSISAELKRRGREALFCPPLIDEVSRIGHDCHVCLVFVESADEMRDLLIFLKDAVYDRRMSIGLVGERLELQEAVKVIKKENVSRLFSRPVNAIEVTASLLEMEKEVIERSAKKRILIIDDDVEFLRRTERVLKTHYKVYVAGSAVSALMLLSRHKVDLILLDYIMPVLDGLKTLEALKAEPETSDIPVLFLSSMANIDAVTKGMLLGAETCIPKQTAAKDLAAIVSDFFSRKDWEVIKGANQV